MNRNCLTSKHIKLIDMTSNANISKATQVLYTLKRFPLILILALLIMPEMITSQEVLQLVSKSNNEHSILVVTNRAMTQVDDQNIIFEPKLDSDGDFSFVKASLFNEQWGFELKPNLESLFAQDFPYSDWMVFVHGDSKTLLSAVKRAKEIRDLHQVNVILYSWPSKDPELGSIKNFKNSVSNVEASTAYFVEFLAMIETLRQTQNGLFEGQNLSLFFHSLGNYYLEQLVADGYQTKLQNVIFDNLIINAAAVEQKGHNEWVEQLAFSNRIYINSNDDDFSLTGLRMLTKLGRQLGESALPPYASNATYVDFTDAVGFPGSMGPSHSYYFASIPEKSENIKKYYTNLFHGREASLTNPDLFVMVSEESPYSIRF